MLWVGALYSQEIPANPGNCLMFSLDNLTAYWERMRTQQTGSALSPLLWLNALVTAPCLVLFARISTPKSYFFAGVAGLLIIFTLRQYQVLRGINPRLLQSEKHQQTLAMLDLVIQKGGEIVINPVDLNFSVEPERLAPPNEDGEEYA